MYWSIEAVVLYGIDLHIFLQEGEEEERNAAS
jgi:hypothetical protein